MADLKPTIKTNFYGFDYYEVAYTCLATQHPALGNFKFPSLTFASDSDYLSSLSSNVQDTPSAQTIGQIFSQNIADRDVITINDVRANNVITNNIGVEFYTETWKNALDLCKDINTFHTWSVGVGGNYANEDQRSKVRRSLWNKWWKTMLYAEIDVSEFFQMGLKHSLEIEVMEKETVEQFKAWLEEQHVCTETRELLLSMYDSTPLTVNSEFNDIEEIYTEPLVALGVYHAIEKIDVTSTSAGCFSPYGCPKGPTASDFTNMSQGTESEQCVTYWLTTTPATSSLSSGYTGFSGTTCQAMSGNWSKYQSASLHRPRFDFIKINGRMMVPNETFVSRNGISIIRAQDLFDACNTIYDATVTYSPFTQSFESPYGECCVVLGGKDKNWVMNAVMKNPYNIQIMPKSVSDSEGTASLIIPSKFFTEMKSNPALLNQEFAIEWNVKLQVSGKCLADAIIQAHSNAFYPFCVDNTVYYQPNCGIIFNNVEGFTNGAEGNALVALNEMHDLVRRLFANIYNCYAREVSKTQIYGDLIKVTGRFYDEHGSECWFLLKQVLRPTIESPNTVTDDQLKGFNLPNVVTTTPTVVTNQVLPNPTPTPSVNLSNMFKKGNKICSTLPPPLKYK